MYNSDGTYLNSTQQDVYADVITSYADSHINRDNQEFSLSSIQERLGNITAPEEVSAPSTPDLMPSSQTLNMSYQRDYATEQTRTKSKMSVKTKIAISSYAIVVLALVIAVTLCSVSVSGAFANVVELNNAYYEATASIEQLVQQTQTEDYDALVRRATELGYIEASQSNTLEYKELETRPAQNFEVETNWFDSLCDWLSNVFGG